MNLISAFFVRNIIVVYFIYGLAFFALSLALYLASRRQSGFRFATAILPLAAFGALHALHEWIEMFQKIGSLTAGFTPSLAAEWLRTACLIGSFILLLVFGMYLLSTPGVSGWRLILPLVCLVGLWGAGLALSATMLEANAAETVALADVLARYSLGIPGAILGTWALMRQQRTFREHGMPQFGRDLVWAATALALFGVVGQVFVRQTELIPSTFLNSATFLQWFGIPIQLFRAVMAAALALFIARALNAFELESQRRLDAAITAKAVAQETQLVVERSNRQEIEHLYRELQGREDRLGQLLRRVVSAQEAERQRIARELHDATGQSLTAISLGLKGVETFMNRDPSPAVKQVHELGTMSTQALGELRRIIADLRPSHLDDLGLAPALRWYLKQYEERSGIHTQLIVGDEQIRPPTEYETILFRITQEALNNVAKHAQAQKVTVTLSLKQPEALLMVEDDGRGFDPAAVQPRDDRQGGWGLMGIRERATLVGGHVEILSRPGSGTRLVVTIPLPVEQQYARHDQVTAG